jgi:hypothetical protein
VASVDISRLDQLDWDFPRAGTVRGSVQSIHWFPGNFIAQIPATLIQILSRPGDLIFDPFAGSATTAVEAAKLGRAAIVSDRLSVSGLIGKAKIVLMNGALDPKSLNEVKAALTFEQQCRSVEVGRNGEGSDQILTQWYSPDTLSQLRYLWRLVESLPLDTRRVLTAVFSDELVCSSDFQPRRDLSGMKTKDGDLQLADLHYRDIREWAVGRNAAAGWSAPENPAAAVKRVWTDPLPLAEVERVAPNEDATLTSGVVFGMEDLAEKATDDGNNLSRALAALPILYETWIALERDKAKGLNGQRQATASRLIADMETARDRISAGIALVSSNDLARTAFRFMNASIAMAARRRNAGANGDPATQRKPEWRPFQLAFILLNLAGLVDKTHSDREKADLLFFPTGGGKTEAYLGLAAFVIAFRRLTGPGLLGAGVAVIMRYTLRLLTLDQLARAAGVVCALELMRTNPINIDDKGRRLLGDWPIEIGLWVGSDASPNKLGGKGNTDKLRRSDAFVATATDGTSELRRL